MRRSSASSDGGRASLGPLRVKNDGGSATKPRSRMNTGLGNRFSTSGRNSLGTGGKKTVTMSRLSTIGGGPAAKKRRSSVKGFGGGDYLKDPRPISDRGYKERSIRKLVEFLINEGYPQTISPKLLQAPPSKDFFKIFEFLYSFIEPTYKIGQRGKVEEEFPRLFKQLGYPFNISKSAMYSVWSPHTWPSLLAALTWLREQIEYTRAIDVDQMLFPPGEHSDFDSIPENKMLFKYYEETYLQFMQGADTFEELEEQLENQIRQNGLGRDLDHLAQDNKQLKNTLKMLEEEPDELLSLKEMHSNLEQDEKKLQTYISTLDQHIQHQEHALTTTNTEALQLQAELAALQADNRRKQQIYDSQEFSPQDVQRINLERQELQRQIEATERENEEIDRQVWDLEMVIGKAQEKIEAKCREYNKVAESLQLIPLTAENAFGIDYELRPTLSAVESDKFAANIKPALTRVKSQCVDKVHEAEEQRMCESEALEQLVEMEGEKREVLSQADTKLRRLEESLEAKREMQQKESQRADEEIEALHSQVAELRLQASSALHDEQKSLQMERTRLEKLQQARQRETQTFCSFLTQAVTLIVDHKCEIQSHSKNCTDFLEKKASEESHSKFRKYSSTDVADRPASSPPQAASESSPRPEEQGLS